MPKKMRRRGLTRSPAGTYGRCKVLERCDSSRAGRRAPSFLSRRIHRGQLLVDTRFLHVKKHLPKALGQEGQAHCFAFPLTESAGMIQPTAGSHVRCYRLLALSAVLWAWGSLC